ncbi:hypothetical protein QQ045_004972 [Rhodiola kirilowii]
MELFLHVSFAFLLAVAPFASIQDAASPAQLYWKMKLPNTPIPRAVQELLPETMSLAQGGDNFFFVASGGVLQSRSFNYMHVATKENLAASKIADIFFFDHKLKPGSKLRIQFLTATRKAKFLSAQVAKTMPVSSKDFPETLTRLLINPNSTAALLMKQTINDCETPSVLGETQVCEDSSVQEYTIQEGVERMLGTKTVACHTKDFAYPVYICHAANTRMVYNLPLLGANGNKVNAVVACHTNTDQWDPNNLSFQMLKVKPGSAVICHFLPEDHIIWGTSN